MSLKDGLFVQHQTQEQSITAVKLLTLSVY